MNFVLHSLLTISLAILEFSIIVLSSDAVDPLDFLILVFTRLTEIGTVRSAIDSPPRLTLHIAEFDEVMNGLDSTDVIKRVNRIKNERIIDVYQRGGRSDAVEGDFISNLTLIHTTDGYDINTTSYINNIVPIDPAFNPNGLQHLPLRHVPLQVMGKRCV